MATPNDRAILNAIINPLLPDEEFVGSAIPDESDETEITCVEISRAKELEKEGVLLAESGNLDGALELFDKAIAESPSWASAYNNKAQALRLLKRDEEALLNLNKAIQLSQGKGKAAAQAYCQRAMLHHVLGQEEAAIKDWESSAKLGNAFARSQLVQRNPYAALCNKMLSEVFHSLKAGTYSS